MMVPNFLTSVLNLLLVLSGAGHCQAVTLGSSTHPESSSSTGQGSSSSTPGSSRSTGPGPPTRSIRLVTALSGEVLDGDLPGWASVRGLKQFVRRTKGILECCQRLTLDGKVLDDDDVTVANLVAGTTSSSDSSTVTIISLTRLTALVDADSRSSMVWAALADQNLRKVEKLLKIPVDPDVPFFDADGTEAKTVLHGNCMLGPAVYRDAALGLAIVKALCRAGADKDKVHVESGTTPLISAVECGRRDLVKFLIEDNADVNIAHTKSGDTPIMIATTKKNLRMVKLLWNRVDSLGWDYPYDLDLELRRKDGHTALSIAKMSGNKEIETFLVESLRSRGRGYLAEPLSAGTGSEVTAGTEVTRSTDKKWYQICCKRRAARNSGYSRPI